MKTHIPILSLSLIALLALGSCKKEKPCKDPSNPECENYDPCYGKKAPSADFIIGQSAASPYFGMKSYEFISDDTMFAPFYWPIDFMAKEEGAKYEWKLGSETITSKRFTRELWQCRLWQIHSYPYHPQRSGQLLLS
jgi:hypothetical protein